MLHIAIVHARGVSKQIPREKKNYLCVHLCVHRDMKHLGSLESTQEARATPRATLTHLSCSPNFPRASYLDERTLTYEPIVNYLMYL